MNDLLRPLAADSITRVWVNRQDLLRELFTVYSAGAIDEHEGMAGDERQERCAIDALRSLGVRLSDS